MDKLLGQEFDEYIDKQIKVRQNSLGKPQKSTDDLQVFNSSTPWIRLTSAVTIGPEKAEQLATNLGISKTEVQGNQLAKNLVLFAGSSTGVCLRIPFRQRTRIQANARSNRHINHL